MYRLFWEVLSSCREARGNSNDGVHQFMFPENSFIASKYVASLMSSPQTVAQGKVARPFHRKVECI